MPSGRREYADRANFCCVVLSAAEAVLYVRSGSFEELAKAFRCAYPG